MKLREMSCALGLTVPVALLISAGHAAAQKDDPRPLPPFIAAFARVVINRDHAADRDSLAKDADLASLRECPGVRVLIENPPGPAKALGVDAEQLRVDVELRLRAAGVPVLPTESPATVPILYVETLTHSEGGATAYFVNLSVVQSAFLEHNGLFHPTAITWQGGGMGHGSVTNLRQCARDQTDRFANEFLKANPKK